MEFKSIRKASKKEHDRSTLAEVEHINNIESITGHYNYNKMLTPTQRTKTTEEQKAFIITKIQKKRAKEWEGIDADIKRIEEAPDFLGLSVSVEWKASRTWGANPKAKARIHTATGWEYCESGSIGGCGYDKESTAIAEAFNQSASLLKELYKVYEKALKKNKVATLHDILGYGSGHGCRPHFEGGCGVSCCYKIFKAIGFTFENTSSGKMFDCYNASKIAKGGKK